METESTVRAVWNLVAGGLVAEDTVRAVDSAVGSEVVGVEAVDWAMELTQDR